MSLKEATTNSLLMFVAATCVVLIVKAMPSTQATVQAVAGSNSGTSGPAAQRSNTGTPTLAVRDGVTVYYLHGNVRCPTCRTIEACAQEAVQNGFADELKTGKINWQVVNYESPGNEHYATDYQVVAPNVVLAMFKDGKQVKWKGLPEVWEHVGDKPALVAFVQTSLSEFLGQPQVASSTVPLPVARRTVSTPTAPIKPDPAVEPSMTTNPTAPVPDPAVEPSMTTDPTAPIKPQPAVKPSMTTNPVRSAAESAQPSLPLPE